jgi:proline iminopeptidase
MRKHKMVVAIVAGVLVLLAGAALWFWRMMGEPLYRPGMVRAGENLRGPLDPPAQPTEGSFWLVEADIKLAYRAEGSGRPVLVLHGGPGYPIRGSVPGLDRLVETHTLYYYDQRGCGRSTRPFDRFESRNYWANMKELERTLGVGAQLADVERVRRILGQEKLILVGHSFGAFLAALYAAEFPDRVEALVLVAPSGVLVLPDEGGGFFELVRDRLPADRRAEYDRFLAEYLDFGSVFSRSEAELAALNRKAGEYFLAASRTGGEAAGNSPPTDNGGWVVQAMYFSMGKRHDYRDALRQVTAPVLVIHGEDDIVDVRVSRLYSDTFPNGRLHVLGGGKTRGAGRAGHFLMSDQPGPFAEVVTAFLKDPGKK